MSRLIQAATSVRVKVLITVLAYTGLRNAELCNLSVGDVDLARNTVRVRSGKGSRDRIVAVAAECVDLLAVYIKDSHREADDRLFETVRHGHPLVPQDVRKIVRTTARRAGLERRVYPHLLRHSLASNLMRRGAGLLLIKEQLGHAFVDTTMIYVASAPDRMRREYEFFRPSYL